MLCNFCCTILHCYVTLQLITKECNFIHKTMFANVDVSYKSNCLTFWYMWTPLTHALIVHRLISITHKHLVPTLNLISSSRMSAFTS